MNLATDAGISISLGEVSLEGAIILEQLAQLGIGLAGLGSLSIAASDVNRVLVM